jgi:hypothetical protein
MYLKNNMLIQKLSYSVQYVQNIKNIKFRYNVNINLALKYTKVFLFYNIIN